MTSVTPSRNWRSMPVSGLISISHGFAFKGEYFSEHGKDAITTPGNFLEPGGFRRTGAKQRYYSGSIPEPYRLDAGDLIVAMTEQAEGLLGSTAFVPDTGSWLHNQRIGRIRAKSDEVSLKYLYYVFNSFDFRNSVAETAAGTKVKHTSPTKLGAVEILLPPRDEQDRIAEKLDDADAMILQLERLIAKKQAIKQGLMQHLLSGKTRLPGFTRPWTEASLGSVGHCVRGVSYDPHTDLSTSDQPFTLRLLRSNNVQGGGIDTDDIQFVHERRVSAKQVLEPGDIVICMANGSRTLVGKSAFFDILSTGPRYTFGAFMGAFRTSPALANPNYVAELLNTKAFRDWLDVILSGSSINNLRPGDVEGFITQFPERQEQEVISDVLAGANDEILMLRRRVAKAQRIKQGLMQQLLTGRTRLPTQEVTS